jgi:vacuolar-type H+-ATPase subunit I/STV1
VLSAPGFYRLRGEALIVAPPENYAHALARLAHAEDHLGREVRASQARSVKVSDLEQAYKQTCRTADMFAGQVLKLEALLVKQEADHAARDAAWSEYLDLRKQIRKVAAEGRTDSEEQRTLVARALDLARLHNFDPPTRALEEAQVRIADLEAALGEARETIASMNLANARLMADDEASAGD